MIDQSATIIEDLKLKSKIKDEAYYYIKATSKEKLKDTDKINIKIAS